MCPRSQCRDHDTGPNNFQRNYLNNQYKFHRETSWRYFYLQFLVSKRLVTVQLVIIYVFALAHVLTVTTGQQLKIIMLTNLINRVQTH